MKVYPSGYCPRCKCCIASRLLRTGGAQTTLSHTYWTSSKTHNYLKINLAASPGPLPLLLDGCSWMEEPQLPGLAQLYLHSKVIHVTIIQHSYICYCTTRHRFLLTVPKFLSGETQQWNFAATHLTLYVIKV